jgi:hypothetical protein
MTLHRAHVKIHENAMESADILGWNGMNVKGVLLAARIGERKLTKRHASDTLVGSMISRRSV